MSAISKPRNSSRIDVTYVEPLPRVGGLGARRRASRGRRSPAGTHAVGRGRNERASLSASVSGTGGSERANSGLETSGVLLAL